MAGAVAASHRSNRVWLLFLAVAGVVLVLDQLTKELTLRFLAPPGSAAIELIPGWFELTCVFNDGGAWNILAGHTWVFLVVALATSAVIVGIVARQARQSAPALLLVLALALVMAGALGNAIDRGLRVQQRVIDMIDIAGGWWPVFNVADMAVCIGVGLLLLESVLAPAGNRHS